MLLSAATGRAPTRSWADTYPAVAHNPLMRIEQEIVEPLLAAAAGDARARCRHRHRALPAAARATGASVVLGARFVAARCSRAAPGAARVCADACRLPFARADVRSRLRVADGRRRRGSRAVDRARWRACSRPAVTSIYSDFHPSWARRGWRRTFRDATARRTSLVPPARDRRPPGGARGRRVRRADDPRAAPQRTMPIAAVRRSADAGGIRRSWSYFTRSKRRDLGATPSRS